MPVITNLARLNLTKRVTFFVGENGTGKSTLLEAIALYCGYGLEGGSRNISYITTNNHQPTNRLADALKLSWSKKLLNGYFLRAESFFNIASYLDELQQEDMSTLRSYGGESFHQQSHGEAFLTLFQHKFSHKGFYLLDEPEAALSPQRQLSFLVALHETLKKNKDIQFIIASHSPIILAYPESQIFSFNDGKIEEVEYRETEPYLIMSGFIANPNSFLQHLIQ